MSQIRVGAKTMGLQDAKKLLSAYTDVESNLAVPKPYAYPAYDQLDTGSGATELNDGDLLAPQLLNVKISLAAFYALKGVRGFLQEGLSNPVLERPLQDQSDDEIAASVGRLYDVLDTGRLHGVKGTTLSKVLHRKRPESLVLRDRQVHLCYVGESSDFPVPRVKTRSWADYMTQLTCAIRADLVEQSGLFEELRAGLGADVDLTPVRILDILAWRLGRPDSSVAA